MADLTCRWTGADATTPNLWTDVDNWIDVNTGLAPAHTPGCSMGDTDTILFDTALANPVVQSPAGFDQSAAAGAVALLIVGPLYNGTIGTDAVPLTLKTGTPRVEIEATGAGAIYLTGAAANGITLIDVTAARTLLRLGGVVGTLRCWSGNIELRATSTIQTAMYVGYINSKTGDVRLLIPAGATLTPAAYQIDGGTIDCSVAIDTLNLNGGTWRQNANLATLNLNAGIYQWYSGTITTATLRGGTLTAGVSQIAREVTTLVMYAGSTCNLHCNRLFAITLGVGGIIRWGGLLTLNVGMTIID